jgi:3-isopropylmalate/(R)-2-methylmalate dehydratase small subunit
MRPFTTLRSRVVALTADDIDTDQIIPADLVNVVGAEALAAAAFGRHRRNDPSFVMNRPDRQGRSILFVGRNFGCGSSREAAVWALRAWGVRAIVGVSFNATFLNNCLQNAVVPLTVDPATHADLRARLDAGADPPFVVDLPAGRVVVEGTGVEFPAAIEPFARDLLVRGQDELGYLLDRRDRIAAYERDNGDRP